MDEVHDKKYKHNIEVVVDRLVVREGIEARLVDLEKSSPSLMAWLGSSTPIRVTRPPFPQILVRFRLSLDEIEPRLFSFNSPFGACPTCDGLGVMSTLTPGLIVPDRAVDQFRGHCSLVQQLGRTRVSCGFLDNVLAHCQESADTPWEDLTQTTRDILLQGSGRTRITMIYRDNGRRYRVEKPFEGVVPNIARRWREVEKPHVRDELSRYQLSAPCEACGGKRLKPEALTVHVDDKTIADISDLSIADSLEWFSSLTGRLSAKNRNISARILKEITERLTFLSHVGLGYLTSPAPREPCPGESPDPPGVTN